MSRSLHFINNRYSIGKQFIILTVDMPSNIYELKNQTDTYIFL